MGAGTEGFLNFAVPNTGLPDPCMVTVWFDNPYMGGNKYSCTVKAGDSANCGGKVYCQIADGSGNDGMITTSVWRS